MSSIIGQLIRKVILVGESGLPVGESAGPPTSGFLYWSGATSKAMDSSWISDEIDITNYELFSIDVLWTGTGTPVGTLYLEVSDGTSWAVATDFNGNALTAAVSGASSAIWDLYSGTSKCRIRYVRTSGGTGATIGGTCFRKG